MCLSNPNKTVRWVLPARHIAKLTCLCQMLMRLVANYDIHEAIASDLFQYRQSTTVENPVLVAATRRFEYRYGF